MKAFIIIPTLNEVKNIEAVIEGILSENIDVDVLVVDGCSTDGTFELVEKLSEQCPNVSMIQQQEK